jgi:phosphohistidine phosphatase SixA
MNASEFLDLTEGRANPGIEKDSVEKFLFSEFEYSPDWEIILTSNKLRTIESAKSIKKYFNLDIPIVSDDLFDEIPSKVFNPPKESDWSEMKRNGSAHLDKKRVLDTAGTLERIMEIEEYIKNIKAEKILVVSHSYLIGQLNYWFNFIDRDANMFDSEVAKKYEIGGYLKGFKIVNSEW